jgi:hypothetical protein
MESRRVDPEHVAAGQVTGTLICIDPSTGAERSIVAFSGTEGEATEIAETMGASLTEKGFILAPAAISLSYWAGRSDPGFVLGRNPDGTEYTGDSSRCVEPRLFQEAVRRKWLVRAMTLAWRGSGPNPLPRPGSTDPRYMTSCPSCLANVGAIMAFVRWADATKR